MSIPLTEFVMLPTEIISTPVLPYFEIFFELIPPDASKRTFFLTLFFFRI